MSHNQRNFLPETEAATFGHENREQGAASEDKMLAVHNMRLRRKMAKTLWHHNNERSDLMAKKYKVSVTSTPPVTSEVICMTERENKRNITFSVTNSGTERVYLTIEAQEFVKGVFTLRDCTGKTINSIKQHPLQPEESFILILHISCDQVGYYDHLITFKFEKGGESSDRFEIVHLLVVNCKTSCCTEQPAASNDTVQQLQTVRRTPSDESSEVLLRDVMFLRKYKMPRFIKDSDGCDRLLHETPFNWENYSQIFHILLYLEDFQIISEVKAFNREEAFLVPHKTKSDIFMLRLLDNPRDSSVLSGSLVYVTPLNISAMQQPYKGWVHDLDDQHAYIRFGEDLPENFKGPVKCRVEFTVNRTTVRMQLRATELVYRYRLRELLFPTGNFSHNNPVDSTLLIQNNREQSQAIQHILACSAKPAPYLIFGPPGTGKTVTLVQVIKEIVRTQTCNILVCAPSNSATDHLCERILDGDIGTDNVFRMYSLSFPRKKVPPKIKMHCNIDLTTDTLEIPTRRTLMRYKILVTTLLTAGRLVTGGIPLYHYKYIIVDEAGQATETECLVPIAGLLRPLGGQVVLAGDPKQLGPIISSNIARKHGFGVSMLERLMRDFQLYKPHMTRGFNERFVTKLKNNYRSHPAIIKIPNELFYDGELVCASRLQKGLYNTWELLTNKDIPVIFHGVAGVLETQSAPSASNLIELNVLMGYLKSLINHLHKQGVDSIAPKEIGIITPYKKQLEMIQRALQTDRDLSKENLKNILIGSAETFQGKECNVILVSTVRSYPPMSENVQKITLGFVSDEKRFNVMMTRAKSLLIVVGDPRLLLIDPMWNRFIQFCKYNSTYRGIKLPGEENDTQSAAPPPNPWK